MRVLYFYRVVAVIVISDALPVFHSMGTAWHNQAEYPWEIGSYIGGIETVKVNLTLRIYSNKWHVYAGLAILNPHARIQIDQYAKSCTEIFKLMLGGSKAELRERVYTAGRKVFPDNDTRRPIFLSESVLDQFTLSRKTPPLDALEAGATPSQHKPAAAQPRPNSHLAILAMIDSWAALDILPFSHLDLAATPIFRMWIGIAEALYRNTKQLDAAIEAAIDISSYRSDDLEFVIAARGWSQCVSFGSFKLYEERFMVTRQFFEERFEEAVAVGGNMIQTITKDVAERAKQATIEAASGPSIS